MSHQTRRKFSAEEKAALLRQHCVDKKPVSDVCDEHGIQPSVFYNGQEERLAREIESLRAKLAKKDNVIAEVSEEFVRLKKELGEP